MAWTDIFSTLQLQREFRNIVNFDVLMTVLSDEKLNGRICAQRFSSQPLTSHETLTPLLAAPAINVSPRNCIYWLELMCFFPFACDNRGSINSSKTSCGRRSECVHCGANCQATDGVYQYHGGHFGDDGSGARSFVVLSAYPGKGGR